MRQLLRLLNSRKFAVYLLVVLIGVLILSTFLPSEITVSTEKWFSIRQEKPVVYWLATHFSTPYLVRHPIFLILSLFLFLSTLTCTVIRLQRWIRTRKMEFEKEKAFSFEVKEALASSLNTLKEQILSSLHRGHWKCAVSQKEDFVALEGQKGFDMGFWGSVVFHLGLIVCFLAVPVSALTVFRGELVVTEGFTMPMRDGMISHEGKSLAVLPDVNIRVHDLTGVYAEGIYKVHFGGVLNVDGQDFPFSVNNAPTIKGFQFTLNEFGNAPKITIEKNGKTVFDYFLNLRNPRKGDYFDMPSEDLRIFAIFFPDFIREGNKIATKSKDVKNPVLMVKFFREKEEMGKGLIAMGDTVTIGDYRVTFEDLRNWVNFIVVRETGVPVLGVGMVIGLIGLFVRFLSNERRLEVTLNGSPGEVIATIKGYSRYYPAFLEKEVREMAARIRGGE